MAVEIGTRLNLDPNFSSAIGRASLFHDIGKITVPGSILDKPAALSPEEWVMMKTHCKTGHAILSEQDDQVLDLAARIALSHHEAFDGTGYPHAHRGSQIPIEGRIVGLCDVYDALREDRAYRAGFDHGKACDIILKGDGRTTPDKFDPDVLAAFAGAHRRFDEIVQSPESHT